jgi:hypothetical protein
MTGSPVASAAPRARPALAAALAALPAAVPAARRGLVAGLAAHNGGAVSRPTRAGVCTAAQACSGALHTKVRTVWRRRMARRLATWLSA